MIDDQKRRSDMMEPRLFFVMERCLSVVME